MPHTSCNPALLPRPLCLRVSPLSRVSNGLVMVQEEDISSYFRILGIPDDATYDQIMDAWMLLSETYGDDPVKIDMLEDAKEKVINHRLNQRISGTLKPTVAESPWDEKPIERTPIWVIVGEYANKLFEFPSRDFALKASAPS